MDAVRASLGWKPFVGGFRDRVVWLAILAGGIGLFFPPAGTPLFWRLAFGGFVEELTFRALLQESLDPVLPGAPTLRRFGLVPANLLISGLFALAHLPTQPVLAALSTFFPSIVFGAVWARTRSLWLCTLLHLYYNIMYAL